MPDAIERALVAALTGGSCDIGEIRIEPSGGWYTLFHREEAGYGNLRPHQSAEDAIAIARFDDAGKYRALKTAPNLARGWQLQLATLEEVRCALDYFYPGRLAVWTAFRQSRLETTSLRETLARQTGMYRAAARATDAQIDDVVSEICRSNGGCLRTILWKRDSAGENPSRKLPAEKFDPSVDQARDTWRGNGPAAATVLPLLCQEACHLLVGECRRAVASAKDAAPKSQ